MYELKGLIARVIDFFDPDKDTYRVVKDPSPLTLYPHVQDHIKSKLS